MALFGKKKEEPAAEEETPAVKEEFDKEQDRGELILSEITALKEQITMMAQRQEEALGGLEEILKDLSEEEEKEKGVLKDIAGAEESEVAEEEPEEVAPSEEVPEDIKEAEASEEKAADAAEAEGEDDVAEMIRKEVPELEEMLGDEKFQKKLKNLSEEEQQRIMEILKEDPVKGARMIVEILKGEGPEEEDLSQFAAMPIEQSIDAKERDEIKDYFGASA